MNTIFNYWTKSRKVLIFICPFGIILLVMIDANMILKVALVVPVIIIYGMSQYIDGTKFGMGLNNNI